MPNSLCPLRERESGIFIYYLHDHLGNTRVTYSVEVKAADDMDYTVQSATDYYPYGKALRTYGKERYQSTYHERDVESGFDYRGARFYDGEVVRFNSLDPLAAEFVSWSPYNYVMGNPLSFIDPDGKSPDPPNEGIYINKEGKILGSIGKNDNIYMTKGKKVNQKKFDKWKKKGKLNKKFKEVQNEVTGSVLNQMWNNSNSDIGIGITSEDGRMRKE